MAILYNKDARKVSGTETGKESITGNLDLSLFDGKISHS